MAVPSVDLAAVKRAHEAIREHVVATPCLPSQTLSALTGAQVFLKFENLQFTASFKERGSLNKILSLTPAEQAAGVITVSAGNHAQGVAYHARRLGMKATIVMPETAPLVKIARVRDFGADVVLHGRNFAEASSILPELIARDGMALVHPFDDLDVIAGQGTIALEMLEAVPDLDVLVVPVGGGGMIAGMAVAARAINPAIEVVGVQSELFPGMAAALGKCDLSLSQDPPIADGIAVLHPGALTTELVRTQVDDVLVVREDTIEDAIAMLLEIEKTLTEGAGAAGLAALLDYPDRFRGKRVGIVIGGGNIDMNVLSSVLQRALVRRGRVIRLYVTTLDVSGILAKIATIIAASDGNIRHVSHDRTFAKRGAKTALVVLDVEIQDVSARESIRRDLEACGMHVDIEP